MKIHGIIWLEEIVEKLESKHGVAQHEVVAVLASTPCIDLSKKDTVPMKRCMQLSVEQTPDAI